MVNRLHSSPVAYMDRMENVLASAGAEKGRCGSAHTGIRAENTVTTDNIF